MAELSLAQRRAAWIESQGGLRTDSITTAGTKQQWERLINSLDTFIDTNVAVINASIPLPERATFTAREKAYALRLVLKYRFLMEV